MARSQEETTMPFVTLTAREIERLHPMGACIDVMERALVDLERGELSQPLRSVFVPPGAEGAMAWMLALLAGMVISWTAPPGWE